MDYFLPTVAIGIMGFAVYNCVAITNCCIRFLLYSPGQGEIYKKNNPYLKTTNYYIRNPEHDFRLNYVKTPCFDMDVGFFLSNIKFENKFISTKQFEEKYSKEKVYKLKNHGMGVINDIYHTNNIKKGQLYGFINIMTEDQIYIFIIEEGHVDIKSIFDQYEEELFVDELD